MCAKREGAGGGSRGKEDSWAQEMNWQLIGEDIMRKN